MKSYILLGEQIIKYVRQEVCFQYGSGILNQTKARKISEYKDQERMFIARQKIQRFRLLYQASQFNLKQCQYLKVFKEIKAANCTQMAILSFIILKRMLTPGFLIENRVALSQNIRLIHNFVAVKPLNAVQNHSTLIIDPWPANQLVNPKVVFEKNHYCSGRPYKVSQTYCIENSKLQSLNQNQIESFHKKQLKKFYSQMNTYQSLETPLWEIIKKIPLKQYPTDFIELATDQKLYQIFKKGRLVQNQVALV